MSDNVKNIGEDAFYGTAYYKNDDNWVDGVLYVGNHLIKASIMKGFSSESYTIKEGTITIGAQAFDSKNRLKYIIIPDSVIWIGDSAFKSCSGLKSINLPSGLKRIGMESFRDCTELTEINIPDSVESIEAYAFAGCSGLTKMAIPCSTEYVFSSFLNVYNLKTVYLTKGNGTMISYEGLGESSPGKVYYRYTPWYISRSVIEEIVLEDGISNIGDEAFRELSVNAKINIPNSVKVIGEGAFFNCDGIENFVVPEGVERIDECAFSCCANLKSITIPNSITYIDSVSFSGSRLLKIIYTSNQYVIEIFKDQYDIKNTEVESY